MKECKNNKGMSLIEVIVAMSVLAILSTPILGIYLNSAKISSSKTKQMDLNNVMLIIKDNLTNAVKFDIRLSGVSDPISGVSDLIQIPSSNPVTYVSPSIKVTDRAGNEYPEYTYTVTGGAPLGVNFPNTRQFKVTLKKKTSIVSELNLKINTMDEIG